MSLSWGAAQRLDSEWPAHQAAGPKASGGGANTLEAARGIERFRVRVSDDVEGVRAACTRGRRAVIDEQAAESPAPGVRLDEQRIQLDALIVAGSDGRETLDGACDLENKNIAG